MSVIGDLSWLIRRWGGLLSGRALAVVSVRALSTPQLVVGFGSEGYPELQINSQMRDDLRVWDSCSLLAPAVRGAMTS